STDVVQAGDKIYFVAYDETRGYDLWLSDGTTEGTRLVADANPDAIGAPSGLVSVGDLVYYYRSDNTGKSQLWRTDGTTEGTFKLLNASAIRYSSGVPMAVALDGKLIFGAYAPTDGLWISDGTVAGTKQIAEVGAYDIVRLGDKVYFSGYDSAHGG